MLAKYVAFVSTAEPQLSGLLRGHLTPLDDGRLSTMGELDGKWQEEKLPERSASARPES